jgi:hypothetical protein
VVSSTVFLAVDLTCRFLYIMLLEVEVTSSCKWVNGQQRVSEFEIGRQIAIQFFRKQLERQPSVTITFYLPILVYIYRQSNYRSRGEMDIDHL